MNIETTIGSVQIDVWGRSAEFFLDESTYDLTAFRSAVAAALEAGNSEGSVEFRGNNYVWRIDETDWMEHTADDGSSDIACYADYTRRMRAGR